MVGEAPNRAYVSGPWRSRRKINAGRVLRSLRICGALFCALPVLAQALHMSSASGSPGENVTLELSIDLPAGQNPTILKWETIFPAQLLEVDKPEISTTVADSGKSLTCNLREAYTYVCLLAGGQRPLENGPIATFRFKIRAGAHSGTSTVRIDHVEAATKDLQALKVLGGEGHILIH